MIGETISHYRVLTELGRGGMGVVYRAEDTRLGRLVALKFIPDDFAADRLAVERFRREARAASQLNHPGICTVYDVGEHNGRPFIAMELLEGRTLREHVANKPLPIDEVMDLALQLADALDAAHAKGIVHRDIKSTNAFLLAESRVKVLDFGLAKLQKPPPAVTIPPGETESLPNELLTSPGAAIGTVAWMSPEQACGEEVDHRSDLYSLGVVLYEMVTGQLPFRGKTSALIFDAILNQEPTSPLELNPDVPDDLARIIHRALEKDREIRYQTASDLRADLKRLKRDISSGTISTATKRSADTHASSPRSTGRRSRLIVTIGAVALLPAAVLGWQAWQASHSAPQPLSDSVTTPDTNETTLIARQLTANPAENFLYTASISPKGTYLAYTAVHDRLALRAIDGGDILTLAVPQDLTVYHVSWFPDETKLLVTLSDEQQKQSLWTVFVAGGTARKLRDDVGVEAAVSPDGKQIVFANDIWGSEIWLMDTDGRNARRLMANNDGESVMGLTWYPDGQRILYIHVDTFSGDIKTALESCGVSNPERTVVVSDVGLPTGALRKCCCLPGGVVVYATQEPTDNKDWNLWAVRTDSTTGRALGEPQRVTNYSGFSSFVCDATLDGNRLAVMRSSTQSDVYVAELQSDSNVLVNPRRLTLDDRNDQPDSWMTDNRSILFTSNRSGTFDIYQQSVDGTSPARPVVTGPEDEMGGQLTHDGEHFVYVSISHRSNASADSNSARELMRVAVNGGRPHPIDVLQERSLSFRCAPRDDTPNVLGIRRESQLVFYAFDLFQGKGDELARVEVEPLGFPTWDLSPDGMRIAVATRNGLCVVSLVDGSVQPISLSEHTSFQNVAWSADGQGLFATPVESPDYLLVYVTLDGQFREVWRNQSRWLSHLRPSPDGQYIAFAAMSFESNVWLLENFLPSMEENE